MSSSTTAAELGGTIAALVFGGTSLDGGLTALADFVAAVLVDLVGGFLDGLVRQLAGQIPPVL